jgi:hypothetical protein
MTRGFEALERDQDICFTWLDHGRKYVRAISDCCRYRAAALRHAVNFGRHNVVTGTTRGGGDNRGRQDRALPAYARKYDVHDPLLCKAMIATRCQRYDRSEARNCHTASAVFRPEAIA